MNLTTFFAMLARDAHVARRNFVPLLLQNLLQPMLFVFIFGRVMTTSGFMPPEYKSLLLPGIVAISMVMSGIQAVAMPLVAEFQFSREIEDRLLAPMEIQLLAALLASSFGLVLGCSVGQTQIGLMFSLVLAPMIAFGCTYYPWQALEKFPVLQRVVLANPIAYASEGLRGALVPQFPHLSSAVALGGLVLFDLAFLALGLRQFTRKAVT
jgi:ABC-2 type transport system permease protein